MQRRATARGPVRAIAMLGVAVAVAAAATWLASSAPSSPERQVIRLPAAKVVAAPAPAVERRRALPRGPGVPRVGLVGSPAQPEGEAADDSTELDESLVADPERMARFDPILAETIDSGLRRVHERVSRKCSAELAARLARRGQLASAPRQIEFQVYLTLAGSEGTVRVGSALAPIWPASIDDLAQLCVMRGFEGAELGADESEFQQAMRYQMRFVLPPSADSLSAGPAHEAEEAETGGESLD